ncbi:hypothetical protein Y032_0314g2225 [Ancylostoma ceylanicum]|uniref:Uncharacterized protein n=1 Tax=Ancylostoma ceylanicum TaxID=53326 RepID=A0A016S262_9BILA|nr:hypothetical protein Y032_0314g2225 [Ancylostoma ceylanicum]
MTTPARYINRHKRDESPVLERVEVAKIWSREVDPSLDQAWIRQPAQLGSKLQAVLAARHGFNVDQRVLTCPIDKINGFTRQFGSANCYKPLTGPVLKNGFKDHFEAICVYRWNQRAE